MTKHPTPCEWFLNAERAYAEDHQGCAWCGGAHRVRLSRNGPKSIYSCQRCDFQASYDSHLDRFHIVPGEDQLTVSETMLDQPIANLL